MRTYWQRLQYRNDRFDVDYMGNAEYEHGGVRRAAAYMETLKSFVTLAYTKPFKSYEPMGKLVFVGDREKIEAFIEKAAAEKEVENKAGYGKAPLWLPVDPWGDRAEQGFVVINVDYLEANDIVFTEFLDIVINFFCLKTD